jgi:nucleoside-diphosphate-sugar epimerase
MVRISIVIRLNALGQTRIITRTRQELDLLDQKAVMEFMQDENPDQVYLAAATVHFMDLDAATYQARTRPMMSHINVGSGIDCTIRELAETVAKVTGYTGRLTFDASKPDSMPRKLLDVSLLKSLGWPPAIPLEQGLTDTYAWFVEHQKDFRE